MFKAMKNKKNYLNSNELISCGMLKRRRLAQSAILNVCDNKSLMRVVK